MFIGTTAAQVSRHGVESLRTGWPWVGSQQGHSRHDLARSTETALRRVLGNEGLLDRVQCTVGFFNTFDSSYHTVLDVLSQDRTGVVGYVIDQDSAGSALATVATDFGTGEIKFVAKRVGESFLRQYVYRSATPVYIKCYQAFDGGLARLGVREIKTGTRCSRGAGEYYPLDKTSAC